MHVCMLWWWMYPSNGLKRGWAKKSLGHQTLTHFFSIKERMKESFLARLRVLIFPMNYYFYTRPKNASQDENIFTTCHEISLVIYRDFFPKFLCHFKLRNVLKHNLMDSNFQTHWKNQTAHESWKEEATNLERTFLSEWVSVCVNRITWIAK